MLLGIDIGTTHCKAGLVGANGKLGAIVTTPLAVTHTPEGRAFYDPDQVWTAALSVIRSILEKSTSPIDAVGIAGMAETGLLVDRAGGEPRSQLIPWFDAGAASHAKQIQERRELREHFLHSGHRPTFKSSLAKILWLRERDPSVVAGTIWLGAADYVAFRLTGKYGTDFSLAGRTGAFRIDTREWDRDWLIEWGLAPDLFPRAGAAGTPVGTLISSSVSGPILKLGTPVAVAGHDHVVSAFAVGADRPGVILDSMGTAESIVGLDEGARIEEKGFLSGLAFGCHVVGDSYYWMGGTSAAGGSIEWSRAFFGDPPLSYGQLGALFDQAPPDPTGILYFPYLAGRGSPWTAPNARGAMIGLKAAHGRPALAKAILEGTAYEFETMRRAAEKATGRMVQLVIAAGGGTRYRTWVQVKADVCGVQFEMASTPETTLVGAAVLAGMGAGVCSPSQFAPARVEEVGAREIILPDPRRHEAYLQLYENGYLQVQEPLLQFSNWIAEQER